MNKRTIVLLSYEAFNTPGGLNRRIRGILRFLREKEWNVRIYCPEYGRSCEPMPDFVIPIRCWPRGPTTKLERILSHFVYSVFLLAGLASSVRNADIVQIEQAPLSFLIPVLRMLTSAPIIVDDFMFMSFYDAGLVWLLNYVLDVIAIRTATVIATASQHSLRYLKGIGIRHVYAPNGIEMPRGVEIPKSEPACLFVGALEFGQNAQAISHLMRILEALGKQSIFPEVTVIGGPATKASALQAEAAKRSINVRFAGRASDESLVRSLERASIGLLPFFSDTPTVGGQRIKALEFISYGLVVISGPEGLRGIDGTISGKNCIIVKDPDTFSKILKEAFESWDNCKLIGLEARKLARNYEWLNTLCAWGEMLDFIS